MDTPERGLQTYSIVWSVAQYVNESWTLQKDGYKHTPLSGALLSMAMSHGHSRKRATNVNTHEMWIWPIMLRIRWTQRKTNILVRYKVGVEEEDDLLCFMKRRKLAKCGH